MSRLFNVILVHVSRLRCRTSPMVLWCLFESLITNNQLRTLVLYVIVSTDGKDTVGNCYIKPCSVEEQMPDSFLAYDSHLWRSMQRLCHDLVSVTLYVYPPPLSISYVAVLTCFVSRMSRRFFFFYQQFITRRTKADRGSYFCNYIHSMQTKHEG